MPDLEAIWLKARPGRCNETHLIRLSAEEQQRFVDLILNPPEPSSILLRAKEAHARLILDSQ